MFGFPKLEKKKCLGQKTLLKLTHHRSQTNKKNLRLTCLSSSSLNDLKLTYKFVILIVIVIKRNFHSTATQAKARKYKKNFMNYFTKCRYRCILEAEKLKNFISFILVSLIPHKNFNRKLNTCSKNDVKTVRVPVKKFKRTVATRAFDASSNVKDKR